MAINNHSRRLTALAVAAAMLLGSLSVRMWFLQAVQAKDNESVVLAVRTRTIRLLPERGRIFDAGGRVVADNKRILTVTIDRGVLKDSIDHIFIM